MEPSILEEYYIKGIAFILRNLTDSEDEMLFTKSEIKYGKCYTPNEMIVKNYQDMFKEVKLELPDTQLIL